MAEIRILRDAPGEDHDGLVIATCQVPDDPAAVGPVVCRTTGAPGTDQVFGTVHEVREHVRGLIATTGVAMRVDPPEFLDGDATGSEPGDADSDDVPHTAGS